MEQIDTKNGAKKFLELVRLMGNFLALPSSVCKQQFVGIVIGLPDVKSLVEHDGEVRSLESVPFSRYL